MFSHYKLLKLYLETINIPAFWNRYMKVHKVFEKLQIIGITLWAEFGIVISYSFKLYLIIFKNIQTSEKGAFYEVY